MTIGDYQDRKIFEYKWSKMTDEEKDQFIEDRAKAKADMSRAYQLQTLIEANLLSDDEILKLLVNNDYGQYTRIKLLQIAVQKELVGQGEASSYFDL